MNDYVELRLEIEPCSETATDVIAAMLAEVGFESFVPDETGLTAYAVKELFDREAVDSVLADFPLEASVTVSGVETVEGRDWNEEWEKNYFQPIVISDRCVIHSSFHKDIPRCRFDIVIDPKMAFGTGHHATTSLIIEQLLERVKPGMKVIDMGTGTGILAILSSMLGADEVTAIEIDGFAWENAVENMKLNDRTNVKVIHGDASMLPTGYDADIFIANINRNIITADIAEYVCTLRQGGTMLLSGFYESDIPAIMEAASPLGLEYVSHTVKGDHWTCVCLTYTKPAD